MAILTVCLTPTLQKTLLFSSVVPGTVNRAKFHRLDASGKGINVTRVLTQLGKKAVHLTQLGSELRPLFLSLCEKDGLSVEWVESNSQIRFCHTILNENKKTVTELVEESEEIGDGTENRLLDKLDSLLRARDLSYMVISGTKAAGFSDNVIPTMVRKAKEKGLKVVLDIRGKDLIDSLRYKPDIVKPNLFEFASTFAADLVRDNKFAPNDTEEAHRRIKTKTLDLCNKHGCRIILTDGSRKIHVCDKDDFIDINVQETKAVNNIGSGDAFTAGLVSALEDGANFQHAITEGIRCGALNAGLVKPGVIN